MEMIASLSASSCSRLSAICTRVITENIMRWSRMVRSSMNSLEFCRRCSMLLGTSALKLFLLFCLCCQRVMSVSTPRIMPSTSFTASSVGTGMISMDSTMLLANSVRSDIRSSARKAGYSRRNSTLPNLSPISK